MKSNDLQVLLATAGAWYLPQTALAMERRDALAGLWISLQNSTKIAPDKFRRCWPFHLAMKPFYHFHRRSGRSRHSTSSFPLWRAWLQAPALAECNVVQAIMGFATEPFDRRRKNRRVESGGLPEQPSGYLLWLLSARM